MSNIGNKLKVEIENFDDSSSDEDEEENIKKQ